MISVDQILLLQRKVESAVQKIEQLKSENDALRTKCSELTNALSEKTELLSSFAADEKKIEDGILSALSRLDSVENSLLDNAGKNFQTNQVAQPTNPAPTFSNPILDNNGVKLKDEPLDSQNDFELGATQDEADSLFGDTTFETENDNTIEDIF